MYHNILKKQFHKNLRYIGWIFLIWPILSFSQTSEPKDKSQYLGIFETIDRILAIDNKAYNNLMTEINKNPLVLTTIDKLQNVEIDPVFLRSIVFHSATKYVNMSADNQCRFYAFLENGLLTRPGFDGNSIPIQYERKGKKLSGVVPFKDFFKYIYKTKCSTNRDINKLFTPENVKTTVNAFEFKIPSNQAECFQIYKEWQSNDYIAPFCRISQNIKLGKLRESQLPAVASSDILTKRKFKSEILRGNNYHEMLGEFKTDYLNHLCDNLGSRKLFCEKYLTKSFWKKVNVLSTGSRSLEEKCKIILKKDKLSPKEINLCANKLTLESDSCHYLGQSKYPAITPRPNCNQQSTALNIGKLNTNYYDCPAKIDNAGISNATRLIFHLNQAKIESSPDNCDTIPTKTFLDFLVTNKNAESWKPRICYNDPFNENKEDCKPVLLANIDYGLYTEKKIISDLLRKLKNAPKKIPCTIASDKEYDPNRLKWKYNCFLVYDSENCTRNFCPKKIYWQNKEVGGISYKGKVTFDYFPNVIRDDQKSFAYMIEEARKYRRKSIKSITELKFYLNLSDTSVIHGVGCVEDLLPGHFRKYRMNQCNPVPFIIDGLIEEKYRFFVSLRTAIDDVHSPRIITWYNVFNSVKNFNLHQPINHWTLYGAR